MAAGDGTARAIRTRQWDADIIDLEIETATAVLAGRLYGYRGEAVVLLHGGPGCPDYLDPVARLLSGHYQAVTFDQRGVGASQLLRYRYSVWDYIADLDAVRRQLGVQQFHLFGHAWGGLLAQLYAAALPQHVGSLFLCNSALGVGAQWRRSRHAVRSHASRATAPFGPLAMLWWAALLSLPAPLGGDAAARRLVARVWRSYFDDPDEAPPPAPEWLAGVSRDAMVKSDRALRHEPADALPQPGGTAWPVVVLYGERDPYGESRQIVFDRFPTARHVVLAEAGNLPWLQAPEAFEDELDAFYQFSHAHQERRAG